MNMKKMLHNCKWPKAKLESAFDVTHLATPFKGTYQYTHYTGGVTFSLITLDKNCLFLDSVLCMLEALY